MKFATDYLDDLNKTIAALDRDAIAKAICWFKEARDSGRMVYVCGNGGSASISSQMVVDILKGASFGRTARFKIIGLADSISTVTAYANDVGYNAIFVEQLRNFAQKEDVLLAVSGSGNSENILKAAEFANSIGCKTIALTTAAGGALKDLAQLTLSVPNTHTGRFEDCFFVITHIIAHAFIEDVVR